MRQTALLRRTVVTPPVSQAERRKDERTLDAAAKANQIARGDLRLGVPRTKPPLRALGYDLDGRLWVQRSVAEGKPNEADVYDNTGRWILVAEWPTNIDLSLWAIRGKEGLGVQLDQDEVQRPVKLAFRQPPLMGS